MGTQADIRAEKSENRGNEAVQIKFLKKLKNSCRKCLQESFPGFIIVVVVKALVLFFFNILVLMSQL